MTVFAGAAPVRVETIAGETAVFVVSITNGSELIDRYSVETFGVESDCVTTEPKELALFPGDTGEVTVTVRPPPGHPAMSRSLAFNVSSGNERSDFVLTHAHLVVGEEVRPTLAVDPNVVKGGRSAEFSMVVGNQGNGYFEAVPTAVDPEDLADFVFVPPRVRVRPAVRR